MFGQPAQGHPDCLFLEALQRTDAHHSSQHRRENAVEPLPRSPCVLHLFVQDGEGIDEDADGAGVDILQDGDAPSQGEGQQRRGADRITTRYLTKFERARVLGTRALQIRCAP